MLKKERKERRPASPTGMEQSRVHNGQGIQDVHQPLGNLKRASKSHVHDGVRLVANVHRNDRVVHEVAHANSAGAKRHADLERAKRVVQIQLPQSRLYLWHDPANVVLEPQHHLHAKSQRDRACNAMQCNTRSIKYVT